jgi:23S rRNA (adenine-N6)-dimethyltransferase
VGGRHELGQNFLVDRGAVDRIVTLVRSRPGPIVEWGTGDGALTRSLVALRRPLTGIEIDPRRARGLNARTPAHVRIHGGDLLDHAPPHGSVVVANIPFHLTTPTLRHLLDGDGWSSAVLVVQWEVARKRAGVGGATKMTAQSWPWYQFALDRRVPAAAFRPRPSVDAGILVVDRRRRPVLGHEVADDYRSWVARVFAGPGRGLADVLRRAGVPGTTARRLADATGRRSPLPRDLDAAGWVDAFRAARRRDRA